MRGRDEGEGRGAAQAMSPSCPRMQNIPSDLLVFHLKITHSQCSGGSEKHNLSHQRRGWGCAFEGGKGQVWTLLSEF